MSILWLDDTGCKSPSICPAYAALLHLLDVMAPKSGPGLDIGISATAFCLFIIAFPFIASFHSLVRQDDLPQKLQVCGCSELYRRCGASFRIAYCGPGLCSPTGVIECEYDLLERLSSHNFLVSIVLRFELHSVLMLL